MQLIAIHSRSEQGQHRPFYCTAEDNNFYFVKGASMGYKGLCAEWVAGRLAQLLGLPIPHIEIVDAPKELVVLQSQEDQNDLGTVPVFASREISPKTDFLFSDINQVSDELRSQILLFDWWTCNVDRILGAKGGNPNMIWTSGITIKSPRRLFVIDHNLAFSPHSNLFPSFWQDHVFHESYPWCRAYWQKYRQSMLNACDDLSNIWNELPDEWTEIGDFSSEYVETILRRCEDAAFWEPVTS